MGWKITGVALVALLAVAALTGCSFAAEQASEAILEGATGTDVEIDDDGGSVSIETEDGSVDISGGESAEVPEGFPSDMPLYEGTLLMASTMDTEDGTVYSLGIETTDDTGDVGDWYRDKLYDEGWSTVSEITNDSGGSAMTSFGVEKGDIQGQVIILSDSGQPTQVSITVTSMP